MLTPFLLQTRYITRAARLLRVSNSFPFAFHSELGSLNSSTARFTSPPPVRLVTTHHTHCHNFPNFNILQRSHPTSYSQVSLDIDMEAHSQLACASLSSSKIDGQTRAPLPGGNARDRRRARRQAERLKKEMETAIAIAPLVLANKPCPDVSASAPAATFTTPIAALPHRRPFTNHNDCHIPTTDYTHYSAPAYQQSPSEYVTDIRTLWPRSNQPTEALGFPTALSMPSWTSVTPQPRFAVPSAMLVGCCDPDIDNLADLGQLTDVRRLTALLGPRKSRHSRGQGSNVSTRSISSTQSDASRARGPLASRWLRDEVPELCSSPSTMSNASLPGTPSTNLVSLPFSTPERMSKGFYVQSMAPAAMTVY